MSADLRKNLRIISQNLGSIYIQPTLTSSEDIERSSLVIYTHPLPEDSISTAIEWAAGSQTPIFCHESDIERLVKEGFGSYRFHGIAGYKEIGFHGGSLEFYPGRRLKTSSFKGFITEACEFFNLLRTPAYHLLFRPRDEDPILYMCSPQVDSIEWKVLTRTKPAMIIGSAEVLDEAWDRFSKVVNVEIMKASQHREIISQAGGTGSGRKDRFKLWPEKVSSSL